MRVSTILFDLDGTLTDPFIGITNSFRTALSHFGIDAGSDDSLHSIIGPPIMDSFIHRYHLSAEDAALALTKYREYFSVKGLYENSLYEGIPALLAALQKDGRQVVLATSKPTTYSALILKHFHLDTYFTHVVGSEMDGRRSKKGEVIRYALELCGLSDHSEVIMVGDREYDIYGAKENGILSAGVLYGYGTRDELTGAGADFIAESVETLGQLLL